LAKKWRRQRRKKIKFKKRKAIQEFKTERAKILKRIANKGATRTAQQKFQRRPQFTNYYRYVDGVYNSYWLGKFVNMFIKAGKKRRALSTIHDVFKSLKFSYNILPFTMLMGTLKKLKPAFKLRKYKVKKGRVIKEYPAITRVTLLYIHVLIKIKKRIIRAHYPAERAELNRKKNRGLRIHNIRGTMKKSLAEYVLNPRKHILIKERKDETKKSVEFMINRRFNKKRKRR
jgi:hypothetical protein